MTASGPILTCPAALYPKLRPGPHTIPADEIEAIQRERLRGAVIHAVATGGYQATSTRELCRLAGVSQRTLYERFGSKEGCLQATYDAVLEPIVAAMREANASRRAPRVRLHAVIEAFHTAVARDRCGATLGLIITAEAAESDLGGPMRLVDHLGELLGACYEEGDGPPEFVIRGAATAVMSVSRSWIYHGRDDELGELAEQLSDWLHGYRSDDTRLLGQGRSGLLLEAAQEGDGLGVEEAHALDDPPTLRQSSQRALRLMAASGATDRDWAVGTCLAYFELLGHVRSDPGSARLAFVDAPGLGPDADGVREQMIQGGVDLYSRHVPAKRAPSSGVGHAVVGASWGLMHDYLEGRAGDLHTTVLCEQLSYLAIAPVLGPEEGVKAILTRKSATSRPAARLLAAIVHGEGPAPRRLSLRGDGHPGAGNDTPRRPVGPARSRRIIAEDLAPAPGRALSRAAQVEIKSSPLTSGARRLRSLSTSIGLASIGARRSTGLSGDGPATPAMTFQMKEQRT